MTTGLVSLAPPTDAVTLTLLATGYLVLPRQVAEGCFPHDLLLARVTGDALVCWPTRGGAGGGLPLKRRTPAGERCVLLSEELTCGGRGDLVAVAADARPAIALAARWVDGDGALHVTLPPPAPSAPLP